PKAYKNGNDGDARKEMALAAFEAGVCINNASVTLVHGMSRPIGALFHVSHGVSNAMLLEKCLGFALDGAYKRFGELGRACGLAEEKAEDKEAALKFIKAVKELVKVCEIPTLKEYGINKDEFVKVIPKMAEDAIASGSPGNTRKEIRKEDCEMIYHELIS
ncbi:MAG: iron-containing alcohol dehydrogenase, partial [Parasporobacterium sp.]|nr:iron-containing alcohol dehydrogenase [Parasporobacterium sp.]